MYATQYECQNDNNKTPYRCNNKPTLTISLQLNILPINRGNSIRYNITCKFALFNKEHDTTNQPKFTTIKPRNYSDYYDYFRLINYRLKIILFLLTKLLQYYYINNTKLLLILNITNNII